MQELFVLEILIPKKMFELIDKYDVTHFGGAPIVLNMIVNTPKEDQKKLKRKVNVLTAGAPPPSVIFEKMENLGFEVMHVYGLTETYGHMLQCAWNEEWNELDKDKKMKLKQDKVLDILILKVQLLWILKQ